MAAQLLGLFWREKKKERERENDANANANNVTKGVVRYVGIKIGAYNFFLELLLALPRER